jgi:hypothetical protein
MDMDTASEHTIDWTFIFSSAGLVWWYGTYGEFMFVSVCFPLTFFVASRKPEPSFFLSLFVIIFLM